MKFTKLAATEVRRLQLILGEAGPRFQLAIPETWPAQAYRTALTILQDELEGDRRECRSGLYQAVFCANQAGG
jgi:hypothetical protein